MNIYMAAPGPAPSGLEISLEKLKEQLTCPVCLEQFTEPKILPCYHSFCLKCLQLLKSEETQQPDGGHCILCPTCRAPCNLAIGKRVNDLPSSFIINNFSDVYGQMMKMSTGQQQVCKLCKTTNVAVKIVKHSSVKNAWIAINLACLIPLTILTMG